MKTSTRVFLVLLRLALGWVILVEGLEKLAKPDWSGEPYLRESSGPLAGAFRGIAGNSVADRLAVLPIAPGQDSSHTRPHTRMPPAQDRDWQKYLERFAGYYGLDDQQRRDAATRLEQREDQFVLWTAQGKITIEKTFAKAPPVDVEKSPAEWLDEYHALLHKAGDVQQKDVANFGHTADAKLAAVKAEASKVRSELASALKAQNEGMRKSLALVLTPEQATMEPMPLSVGPGWSVWDWSLLNWSDNLVKYGLTAVGVCLIAGLFTRTASVIGALLVLSFFLAMPPLAAAPPNPRAEGAYLFINKTFIMALALLVLATVPSGRWLGLDGLLQFLDPRRWRSQREQRLRADAGAATPRPDLAPAEELTAPSPLSNNGSETQAVTAPPSSKDSSDGN